jgi:hypothetical protein
MVIIVLDCLLGYITRVLCAPTNFGFDYFFQIFDLPNQFEVFTSQFSPFATGVFACPIWFYSSLIQ